ncbi:hypothetical protein PC118_g1189 [Phytophthora cactorum]|uniref:Uncharacterized protein n=1 Tax=Phytophthora cactorum TaxID=29920 RepID=A0A8T1GTF3_9STRA|nr:hypothetical protein PC118_g1189 [Phytophthora cactorum]
MKTRSAEALFVQRGPGPRPSVWQILSSSRPKWTRSEVVPLGSHPASRDLGTRELSSNLTTLRRRSIEAIQLKYVSFKDAFGVLGPPMIMVAVVSICWTTWLIILTIAPNKTANYLMNTNEYDNGQFWLIPEEFSVLQAFSVAGLVAILALYIIVLLKMLVWREYHHVEGSLLDRILERCVSNKAQSDNWSKLDFVPRIYRLIWELYLFLKELTGFQGKHRKLWNLCLKALDLTMQYFMLSGLLEAGTPVELIFGFAVFTALNSLFCAIEIINHRFTAFAEILIDSLFDLSAAVLFPIVVLVYSANNFDFDRAVFHINMELLPVGSFERRAQMFASPTEIELFRVSFDSLRIRTVADYFLRIGMNLGFSYRFKRVVEVLIQMQNQRQRHQSSRRASLARQYSNLLKFSKFPSGQRSCQRTAPKSLAMLYLAYSVGVIVVTHRSISTSQALCSSYPECAVFAYRWRDTGLCPCLALIDGNRAPKTYFEWTHPVDATDTVKALAAAGTLETLQLINRQLTVLPDELRGCHNLNYISLINCAVEELPIWAKGFRKLQYLQIEGKVGSDNLGNLADDLFSDMPELRYLQLENITSSGYTRIADQSPMTSVACPWACPSAPTLLSDCGISSTSSSSLYLAAETRRRRRLQAENDTETCSGVAVVDATSLSSLGVQAAELTNTTLTELNLTDNNIADVRDLQLPETLQQLYLSRNKLTSLEIPESWRHLEVLNVSDNPIANFTAEGKDGPRVLIARNTSLSSMEDVVFPATLRQLDVSLTPIANWGNFTPPTDLSDLTAQDSSIELLGPANFSACDRSFTMDFSGNNITTIRGVRFPPNLRTLFLNGSSVTQFEVCKSDVKVLERLEAFDVTTLTLADDSCSDATIPTSVIIANTSYSLCVLTDAAFDGKYKGGKVSSSTSLTTLLLLLFSIASAVLVLLMLFAIKRKIIDERRAKAARAEKLKAEHAASEGSSDDEESDKMKMSSAMLTDDVRSDPDFERYRIPQNDLEVVKQLAKGAGGVVHLAKWKPKNEQVVVKRVAPENSHSASGMTSFTSASQASDDEEVKSLLSSNATLALAVSEKGVMPAFHSDCPRAILDLARMCLSYDPEDRPTAKELWRLLQDLAAPGALLTSSRKATLTESLRHVSTSA